VSAARRSRRTRAGRTGRSWYGSYQVHYEDAHGDAHRYDVTSKKRGEKACRSLVASGASWAELRNTAVVYRRERTS
jgi:hypothetical protein